MRYVTSNCVALSVPDLDQAAAHYMQTLGWEEVHRTKNWVELRTGAQRFFLCLDTKPVEPTFDIVVPDIVEAESHLSKSGWKRIDLGDDETYMRDPYGHMFCISKD